MVLRYDGFRFPQRGKPPLNLKILISRNAFDNSALFHEQLEFARLIGVLRPSVQLRCEIDASSRDPISLYHPLIRRFFPARPTLPAFTTFRRPHVREYVSHFRSPLSARERTGVACARRGTVSGE